MRSRRSAPSGWRLPNCMAARSFRSTSVDRTMKVRIFDDAARASHAVARLVARQLELQPASVLGLPTGRTSVAVYKELVRLGPDFSRARTFNLDEFVGLPAQNR